MKVRFYVDMYPFHDVRDIKYASATPSVKPPEVRRFAFDVEIPDHLAAPDYVLDATKPAEVRT